MICRPTVRWAGMLPFVCLLASPVFGLMREMGLDKLAQGADLIVKGKVIATDARWVEDQRGRHIYTYVTIMPDAKVKGAWTKDPIVIEAQGGTVEETEEWVEDAAVFAKGEEVVVFLHDKPFRVFGCFQGKYSVFNGSVYLKNHPVDVNTFLKTVEKAAAEGTLKSGPITPGNEPEVTSSIAPPWPATAMNRSTTEPVAPAISIAAPSSGRTIPSPVGEFAAISEIRRRLTSFLSLPSTALRVVEDSSASGNQPPRKLSVSDNWSYSNIVDVDSDNYYGSVTVTYWLSGTAPWPNYEDDYGQIYVRAQTGGWQSVASYPTTRFGVNVPSDGPKVSFTLSGKPGGHYFYKADRYASWNGGTVSYLPGSERAVDLETAAQDTQHAQVEIKSVAWTNKVDSDGDLYCRSARLTWTVGTRYSGQGSPRVYEKIYCWMPGGSAYVLYKQTTSYVLTATSARYLDIATPGTKGGYPFRIEIYRAWPDGVVRMQQQMDVPYVLMEPAFEDRFMGAISGANWMATEDYDGDGYRRAARLAWTSRIANGAGPANFFEKVYVKPSGTATWGLTSTTKVYTLSGTGSSARSTKIVGNPKKTLYDFKIEIYGQGQTKPDQSLDPVNSPSLKGYPMETAAEDPPRVAFDSPGRDTFVDKDRDGYARSIRLYWKVKVQGPGSSSVYEKIWWAPYSSTRWSVFATLPTHTVTGTSSQQSRTITTTARGLYKFLIEVYRAGESRADNSINPLSPAGGDYMETAEEDGAPVITNISPSKTSAGTKSQVTITGRGFDATPGTVAFFYRPNQPNLAAPIVSWKNDKIVCQVPFAAGSGPVTVRKGSGAAADSSNEFKFRVTFGYQAQFHFWSGGAPSVPLSINWNTTDCQNEGLAIQRAMATWSAVGANFTLRYGGTTGRTGASANGINEMMWVNTLGQGTIAVTHSTISWGHKTETDVEFNDKDYLWSTNTTVPGNAMDVESLALHELGHVAGLADLYGNYGDGAYDQAKIMFGMFGNGQNRRTLHADDKAGLKWLYAGGPASTLPGGGLLDLAYGPPLTITGCDFAPAAPMAVKPGEKISLGALIENDGARKTPWLWLECWISKSGDPMKLAGLLIEADLIPPLEPGKGRSYVATKSVLDLPPGEYTVVFVAHPTSTQAPISPSDSRVAVSGKRIVIGSK